MGPDRASELGPFLPHPQILAQVAPPQFTKPLARRSMRQAQCKGNQKEGTEALATQPHSLDGLVRASEPARRGVQLMGRCPLWSQAGVDLGLGNNLSMTLALALSSARSSVAMFTALSTIRGAWSVCAQSGWGDVGLRGRDEGLNGSLQRLGTGRVSVTGGPPSVSVLAQPCFRLSSLVPLLCLLTSGCPGLTIWASDPLFRPPPLPGFGHGCDPSGGNPALRDVYGLVNIGFLLACVG